MFAKNALPNGMVPVVKGLCFMCLMLCLPHVKARAQCDNVMNPPMFAGANTCRFYSVTFTVAGPGVQGTEPVSWTATVQNPPVPMGTLASIGLALTPSGTSCTISGTPTITGTFNIQLTASCSTGSPNCFACGAGADCSTCANDITRTITLAITPVRDPVDVMLVLDVSGSMAQMIPGYGMSKWSVLKESVQAFLEDYKSWGECDDRIGVTYFDHRRLDFGSGGLVFNNKSPGGPIPLLGTGSILEDMNSKSPGTTTCLGGGILAGYSAFNPMNPHRNMILFTDGIQNMEPSVSQSAGTELVISDYNIRADGTGFPTFTLDLKAPTLPFRTYTVGIGDNAVTSLLNQIAGAPTNNDYDGESFAINSTVDLAATLGAAFTQFFVESLAQFSPQLIDIRRLNVVSPVSTKFVVNPTADKLLIRVVANPGLINGATIRIEKDGKDLSHLLRAGAQTRRSFFVDTTTVKRYQVALDGEWTVRINGSQGTYQVVCMINDEALETSASLGDAQYAPGDTMDIEATLLFEDQPVNNATRAVAWIARPGQDVNDLFAAAASIDPPRDFPGEKGNDPGQSKYEALMALDADFAAALEPVNDSINLTNQANGKYTAKFSDTEASGVYKFLFRLAGNDSTTGRYERFILRSTVVDFGRADTGKSIFQIVARDGVQYFQLIPKNRFDHFIGPNRLNQVQLLAAGNVVPLTDRLDGSYEAAVPDFSFFNADPDIEVNIKGGSFFKGDYSDIAGSSMTFWDKYRLWFIIALLLLLVFFFLRKRATAP